VTPVIHDHKGLVRQYALRQRDAVILRVLVVSSIVEIDAGGMRDGVSQKRFAKIGVEERDSLGEAVVRQIVTERRQRGRCSELGKIVTGVRGPARIPSQRRDEGLSLKRSNFEIRLAFRQMRHG